MCLLRCTLNSLSVFREVMLGGGANIRTVLHAEYVTPYFIVFIRPCQTSVAKILIPSRRLKRVVHRQIILSTENYFYLLSPAPSH